MNINDDLLCPITLELFNDPITVPCRGASFSRIPLTQSFKLSGNTCPLCRQINIDFNPLTAQKNRTIEKIIENVKKNVNMTNTNDHQKRFEEHVLDCINNKINIDSLVLIFSLLEDKQKEKIVDDILFGETYYGMVDEHLMKIIDNFYNTYDNFSFNFEQKFNKFLFADKNIDNSNKFLKFANFLIKYCRKYYQMPLIPEFIRPPKKKTHKQAFIVMDVIILLIFSKWLPTQMITNKIGSHRIVQIVIRLV
jgi:hypothetical protein